MIFLFVIIYLLFVYYLVFNIRIITLIYYTNFIMSTNCALLCCYKNIDKHVRLSLIANDGVVVGDALGFLEEGDGVGFEFGLEAVEDLFDGETQKPVPWTMLLLLLLALWLPLQNQNWQEVSSLPVYWEPQHHHHFLLQN